MHHCTTLSHDMMYFVGKVFCNSSLPQNCCVKQRTFEKGMKEPKEHIQNKREGERAIHSKGKF